MMIEATTSSCHAGQLVNHHRANNAVMTGTVASRHAMPQRGNKTMTTTTPGRALTLRKDDLSCKPSLLFPLFLRLTTTRSREPLFLYWPSTRTLYKGRQASQPRGQTLETSFGHPSPHSSYLFPLAYTPYYKKFRAFNRGTCAQTLSETGRKAPA
jgi:hypothetical protein